MNIPEVIKSEVVYENYLKIKKDILKFPDGSEMEYDYVDDIESVAILPLFRDEIILLRQYRHPLKRVVIDIPAGMIQKSEDHVDAVKRELVEETGFVTNEIISLGTFHHAPGMINSYVHLFVGICDKKENASPDSTEVIDQFSINKDEFINFINNEQLEPIVPLSYFLAKEKGII